MNGKATAVALQAGIPVHIAGGPGIGKTAYANAFAELVGRNLETFIASVHEPSDVIGLPVVQDDGTVSMAPPDWVKRIITKHKKGIKSIVFMDEISTAPPAMQAGCLRVVNELVVGDVELPKDTWMLLASNPVDTSSGTWQLSAALANRMLHINWPVHHEGWVDGMINGWDAHKDFIKVPEGWEAGIPQAKILVASFIRAKSQLLYAQPDNSEDAGKAWASPRTWDMAARLLAASRAAGLDQTNEMGLIQAMVGEGAGVEFLTWERALDLPQPQDVLANPDGYKIPTRGDQVFTVMTTVVTYAREHMSADMWDKAWAVLARAADAGHSDLAALPARMLGAERQEGYKLPDHIKSFLPVLKNAGLLK